MDTIVLDAAVKVILRDLLKFKYRIKTSVQFFSVCDIYIILVIEEVL
jgi:hypothetical protein